MSPEELAAACAAAMWERDVASRAAGLVLEAVGPGWARVAMEVTETMANGHRIAHGGYVFLLADTAFAFACNTYGEVTVAQGAEVSFLEAAAVGDRLVAEGREVHRRGRSGIYDVVVRRGDTVVALFRGRSRSLGRPLLGEDVAGEDERRHG